MDIFDVLTLLGGLCLFLFGMSVMGDALERLAGGKLQKLLAKLTTGKLAGLLTGLGVTSVIQSSSATTVMVVGFVNSGLMSLKQAINVIMGANIGTTVTAWIISLGGIEGDSLILQLLKPMSFTPVLAVIGIVLYMFTKSEKKKEAGTILLGFAVLMFGMDIMTNSVSGLADVPAFQQLFLLFKNPILGVLAGAVLTAIIQSSSASVGILQALAVTGQVSFGAAIPIIMGQNIGTCITAILAAFGTNRNAKRAALVHLSFNVVGTIVWLTAFALVDMAFAPALFDMATDQAGIAVAHSAFNIACTVLLLPASGLLEKLAYKLVPETAEPDAITQLDELLLETPAVALAQSHQMTVEMAQHACNAMDIALSALGDYKPELEEQVGRLEAKTDKYEDMLSTYLVKLSGRGITQSESMEAASLLKLIGDYERIADHAKNLMDSAKELQDKELRLSQGALEELKVMRTAVSEVLALAQRAFVSNDHQAALLVEPLEQVIDGLKEELRSRHIQRLQKGQCSVTAGFVWADLLNDLERTSDHCSNIAGCILDMAQNNMNIHESVRTIREGMEDYRSHYEIFAEKYKIS